jgi:hypothetical protein
MCFVSLILRHISILSPYGSSRCQHQLMEDIQRCQQENVWTYTDDTAALATMAGAAEAVLAAHGGNAATRTQAALQGASDSANRAQASVNAKLLRLDIAKAAEWKTSDCLKAAGWDSIPRFMTNGGVP